MNKYTVHLEFLYNDTVEVYAESEDEATEKAFEESVPCYCQCIDTIITNIEEDVEDNDD